MAVKESSDELNPAVVVPDPGLGSATTAHTLGDYLALSIATCGVGYLPLMPGTFGSVVGVAIFLLLVQRVNAVAVVVSILVIAFAGIWAASRTEELSGRKDPGKVVVDEVAGQMIALLPLTVFTVTPLSVMVSFTLFRCFDIVKPYPAGRLEGLKGGLGIMCDDLVAGAYAAVIAAVIFRIL
jgi:phosphatidylglycerophosphatase A